jgi:hypothetical protein
VAYQKRQLLKELDCDGATESVRDRVEQARSQRGLCTTAGLGGWPHALPSRGQHLSGLDDRPWVSFPPL